uniref:Uncharacterized protein n=1 Tax=Romanomermis culicivorax TaxID=13658 RepID=A0A915JNV6_ROMCU
MDLLNANGAVLARESQDVDILSNYDVDIQPTLSLFSDGGNDNIPASPPPLLDDDDDDESGKIVDDDVDEFRLPPLTPSSKNAKNVEEASQKNGNGTQCTNQNTDLNGPHLLAVIWRRILGCLGNMNSVDNPDIHYQYTNIICRLVDTLLIIRQNHDIVQSTLTIKKMPILIPPYPYFVPFLISNVKNLAPNFRKSKLQALDALCKCMTSKLADVQYTDSAKNQFLQLLDDILCRKDTNDEFCVLLKNASLLYNFGFLSRDFCRYILRDMDLENTSDDSKLLAINVLNICLLTHYDEDAELIIDKLTHFTKISSNFLQILHALRGLTIYACISMLKTNYNKPCLQTLLSNLENSDPRIANFTSQCLTVLLDFNPEDDIRRKVIEKYLSTFKNYSNPNLIHNFLLDFCHWCSITRNLKNEILRTLLEWKAPRNSSLQYVLRLLIHNFDRFTIFPCQINEFTDKNWTILKFNTLKFIFSAKVSDDENFHIISRNETSKNFLSFTNLHNVDCKALKLDVNQWLKVSFDSKNKIDGVSEHPKMENSAPPQLPRSENADSASLERLLNFLQYTSPECFEKFPSPVTVTTCEREAKLAAEIRNWDLKPREAERNSPSNFEEKHSFEKTTDRNCFLPFFDWGLNLIGQNRGSGDQWAVEALHDLFKRSCSGYGKRYER